MELYDQVACQAARQLTLRYSTSFGTASRLLDAAVRSDIYNIYGLVRIADEVVDTYLPDATVEAGRQLIDELEQTTYTAMDRAYSSNLIVHAFQLTARRYGIGRELIEPFFASMRADLDKRIYQDRNEYEAYIYGSAEVIGLMCLKVFAAGDTKQYQELRTGARALGSAYQKVNFLRDIAADRQRLGRSYFPEVGQSALTETAKAAIIADIEADFKTAEPYIGRLPKNSRAAVTASYRYYRELLGLLKAAPASELEQRRLRIPDSRKLWLAAAVYARQRLAK
jgi:phytoene/squalene synthetase